MVETAGETNYPHLALSGYLLYLYSFFALPQLTIPTRFHMCNLWIMWVGYKLQIKHSSAVVVAVGRPSGNQIIDSLFLSFERFSIRYLSSECYWLSFVGYWNAIVFVNQRVFHSSLSASFSNALLCSSITCLAALMRTFEQLADLPRTKALFLRIKRPTITSVPIFMPFAIC